MARFPSARQLAWHQLQQYAFIHFTVNTFTDREWGNGDEPEKVFNPSDFDADQIVGTIQEAGLRGVVLTCKHHDGFCLWPSKYTEHSVKNSPWKNGKGDVVKEISAACRRHGLKFGVYLSPWDRNHKDYARPAYIAYYRNQLRELLTNYGPIFELWFDGANGGSGYYGGARERRNIDNRTYYDWENTWKLVRELQPDACMFSDGGPDLRWIGNESGFADETCWATLSRAGTYPGRADGRKLVQGERNGADWLPGEVDVSIRPGWFYHAREDQRVRSPANLLKIYYESVGRGANLILNIPPDRRGRIHENDVKSLREWRQAAGRHLCQGPGPRRQGHRLEHPRQRPEIRRRQRARRQARDLLGHGRRRDHARIGVGPGPAGHAQRRPRARVSAAGAADRCDCRGHLGRQPWQPFATATSVGNQRLLRGKNVTTSKVRLRVTKAAACPAISEFALFLSPE